MKFMPSRFGLFNELDNLFSDPFTNFESSIMKTDIRQVDNNYVLDIELPGYKKEDVQLNLENGYLSISANHEANDEEKNQEGQVIRQERSFGSCQRSFYVGDYLEATDIKAKFDNGILQIVLPCETAKPVETKQNIMIE